jgi:hypothetical protein
MFYATITTNNNKYKLLSHCINLKMTCQKEKKWLRKTINTTHFVQQFDFLKPTQLHVSGLR